MSEPAKLTAEGELERIEEALVQSILDAAEGELRKEIIASKGDPDALIARLSDAVASARSKAAQMRLEDARAKLSTWRKRSSSISASHLDTARKRLENLRSGNSDPDTNMLMAARKSTGLSASDTEGLIEDLAELNQLENNSGKN